MTRIKYATVLHIRGTDRLLLGRGKETGRTGWVPDDESDTPFGKPIYAERVVELPETMTPTEYDTWIEEEFSDPEVADPASEAMTEVADEKGIDTSDWEITADQGVEA